MNSTIEELRADIGRLCYLKQTPGMLNPFNVAVGGVAVAPEWEPTGESVMVDGSAWMAKYLPTDRPRVFRVEGTQYNFKGEPCYALQVTPHAGPRCAHPSEVIFVPGSPRKMPPGTVLPQEGDTVVESDYVDAGKERWGYSRYRATLLKGGKPFAIVTPDGSKAITPEDADTLLDALNQRPLRLLMVFYGHDTGLVCLDDGRLLAATENSHMSVPSDIPRCTVDDHTALELFGEEHCWSDLISYLQSNYDWTNKNLP